MRALACGPVANATHTRSPLGLRTGPWRYVLGAVALALAGIGAAIGATLDVGGAGHSHRAVARVDRTRTSARTSTAAAVGEEANHATGAPPDGKAPSATSAAKVAGHRAAVAEVADPEESKSFPAPASVHHKAAITPSTAAAAVVAPGAPSDAEVRKELRQMRALENAARSQALKTAPGGGSIGGNGTITPPEGIPAVVARVIAGGDAIADFPYVFGGGHASFVDNAYDCSGSVSYALAAGGLLGAPETSGSLASWGAAGPGKWITVYANAGHTYMYVNLGNGWIRYDTSGRSGVYASRWQPAIRSNEGFVARHWPGL